jgi:hypothetical protein
MTTATRFIDTADSRETSPEIMEAIAGLSRSDENAVGIWEAPSPEEALAIWERVTRNGLVSSTEFCWGSSGGRWAEILGLEG